MTGANTFAQPWLPVQSGGIRSLVAWIRTDDVKYVASAGRDGTIRVWNADTGSMVGDPLRTGSAVHALVWWEKQNEVVLTSAGSDGSFSNWNPYDGTLLARTITDHNSAVRDIATWATRDCRYLATGGYDGTIRIWDMESGLRVGDPLPGRGAPIAKLIAWQTSAGTFRLASGDDNGTIMIWTPENGGSLVSGPLSAHTGLVGGLVPLPDGSDHECLVSASLDGTIRIWDPEAGSCLRGPFQVDSVGIRSLCAWINSTGEMKLASGDLKGRIRLWDYVAGKPIEGPYGGSVSGVTALTCWPGLNLISGGADGIVRVWDLSANEQLRQIVTGHVAAVWALAAWQDSDGPRLAMAGADGILRISDPDKGTIITQSESPHGPGVWTMTCWRDQAGERRIASGSLDGTICIWDDYCLPVGAPFGSHRSAVSALAWWHAANGDIDLASAGDDSLIRVWNPDSGKQIANPLEGHKGGLLALTSWHDPHGRIRLASAGHDNVMRVWAPETGALAGKPLTAPAEVWALCSWRSADGAPRLASGDFEGTVRLWDAVTFAQIGPALMGDVGAVRALACWQEREGGTRIAAGGDGGVQIWDPDAGESIQGWQVPGGVRALACWRAADGSVRLASGGDDGTVCLWDTRSGLALRTIEIGDVHIWGLSDAPARVDILGRGALVEAIAAQLRPRAASGPTVVTIEGPWGCGKTTLMDLIRQRLTETEIPTASYSTRTGRLTVRAAMHALRQPPSLRPAPTGSHQSADPDRRILTAWFNPWAHQSGQQIWAGLTSAIIEAAQPVLYPTEQDRERYWFSRNVNRIDRHALRRTLQRRILSPVLGVALLTVALPLAIGLVESGKPVNIFGHPVNGVALALLLPVAILVAGSLHTVTRYSRGHAADYLPGDLFQGPVTEASAGATAGETSGYIDPLRRAERGSLYLHQHDVAVVLADTAAIGYDLVVFVDDLDRCGSSATAEVFEAINLFLSSLNSDGLSARFVIGMDSSVIAGHLDQIHSSLNFPQMARQGEDPSAGWTYLRKLVQLPVIVPRVSNQALDDFINSAAGLPHNNDAPVRQATQESGFLDLSPQQPPSTRQAAESKTSTELSAARMSPWRPVPAQLIPWRTMERHPAVHELIRERIAAQQDGSIREAKRLINVWQLYARILTQTQPLDTPADEISRARTLVLLAEIIVRWPALQRYLLRRVDGQSGLQNLSETADDETAWTATLVRLGVDADYHREALAGLRLLLSKYDGKATACLAEDLLLHFTRLLDCGARYPHLPRGAPFESARRTAGLLAVSGTGRERPVACRRNHGIIDNSARSAALNPGVSPSRPITASISSSSSSSTAAGPPVTAVRAPACRISSWGLASPSANRE
jgi:WD40 repeat protein